MNGIDEQEIESTKAYILSLCSAIGGLEEVVQPDGSVGQVYCVGDEALACLRDLKKAIRVDSQNNERTVLKALVEYNVIETDIVPLILSFQKDRNEVSFRFILACVELLVPMTWPVEKSLDDEDQQPEDPNLMRCYRKYKLDLLTPGVFETILAMIMKSVRIPHRDRSIIDHTTIRLALYLFRNLTAIPDLNISQSATMEQIRMSHMQESLMVRYYESDVIEFLLTIASNSTKQSSTSEWNVLVLESIYNIIKHVDPRDVFSYRISNGLERGDLGEISAKLENLLTEESTKKRQKTNYVPTRHNRFGGTYVLDWDGKKRVSHKQVAGFADSALLVEGEKKENRVGVKRKLEDISGPRKVFKNVKALMYLKLTAQSFITSCFNAFYICILKDMEREDIKIVAKDYSRYYYTMKWFLEYHGYEQKATVERNKDILHLPTKEPNETEDHDNKNFDFSLVASVLDKKTVLFCLRHIRIKFDSKEWFDVTMASDCLRQMLVTIGVMAQSKQQEYMDIAEHIQSNLYYEQASLDLLADLIRKYKRQPDNYLKSVMMLSHVLLRLLDQYQKDKTMMFVKRKAKTKPKKKNPVAKEEEQIVDVDEESENEGEARDQQAAFKDSVFKFSAFEQKYISVDVVHAYCSLLEDYMNLDPAYLVCITNMFHRIMVKRRAEFLFWKLPVLDLFNRVLMDSHRIRKSTALKQLLEFIRYSTRQFFRAAKEYPLLFVEALMPNMKSDRTMWEIPDTRAVRKQREQENYMADVNYISPTAAKEPTPGREESQNPEASQAPEEENNNIIDDDMVDYFFSAFDRKKQAEEANKANDEDMDSADQIRNRNNSEKAATHNNRALDMDDYDEVDTFNSNKDDDHSEELSTSKKNANNDTFDDFDNEEIIMEDIGIGAV